MTPSLTHAARTPIDHALSAAEAWLHSPLGRLACAPPGPTAGASPTLDGGLTAALEQAQLVLVCTEGQAAHGAQATQALFAAAAQLPFWLGDGRQLTALGSGPFRLGAPLVVLAPRDLSPQAVEALQLARDHACPALVMGAGGPERGTRARWHLTAAPSAGAAGEAQHLVADYCQGAVAMALLGLVAVAARARRLGRATAELRAWVHAWRQGLQDLPGALTALHEHDAPGPALKASLGPGAAARPWLIVCDAATLSAGRAFSEARPLGSPEVRVVTAEQAALLEVAQPSAAAPLCVFLLGPQSESDHDVLAQRLAQGAWPLVWLSPAPAPAGAIAGTLEGSSAAMAAAAAGPLWPVVALTLLHLFNEKLGE